MTQYWSADHFNCEYVVQKSKSLVSFRGGFIGGLVTQCSSGSTSLVNQLVASVLAPTLAWELQYLRDPRKKIDTCFLHSFYCFPWILLSMIPVGLWIPCRFFLRLENCDFLDISWWKFCDSCCFCWGCRLSFSISLRCFDFSSHCLTKGNKSILTIYSLLPWL